MTIEEYKKLISEQSEKRNKYNNKKIIVDGIKFDSTKEANRYCELKILIKAGEVKNLLRQVKFELISKTRTERAMYYIADFAYEEDGNTIVEDVKGFKTEVYKLKKKLFKTKYPDVIFRET